VEPGDEAYLRQFIVERSGALFRTAYVLTGDRHSAEDLVQSALTKTAANWHRIRDLAAVEGYVRRAMYHEQVSWWRRRAVAVVIVTEDMPERSEASHADVTDLRLVMRCALARLTPRQRTMLVLRYFDDLPESEIAQILGLKVGSVRSQIHRSLQRLKQIAPELSAVRELQ
jgi:RNA polymerase sigma-70 factor (sigma-E family)